MFCGMGGWSIPFIEDGDKVVGIDIADNGYPRAPNARLILRDIRDVDGKDFAGYDFIVGSPPCEEFSIAKELQVLRGRERNVQKGLELVRHFLRIVEEAQPRYWVMENVSMLEWWFPLKPIWRFKISIGGRRTLWGNLPIGLAPEFTFHRDVYLKYGGKTSAQRAKIPYPIARFIADCTKQATVKVPLWLLVGVATALELQAL